jgi:hypothetical protein
MNITATIPHPPYETRKSASAPISLSIVFLLSEVNQRTAAFRISATEANLLPVREYGRNPFLVNRTSAEKTEFGFAADGVQHPKGF